MIARGEPLDRSARFALRLIALVLYAAGFLLFMNLGAKKFDRYLLPAYLPLALIAGIGYAALGAWLSKLFRSSVERWIMPCAAGHRTRRPGRIRPARRSPTISATTIR